MNEPPPGWGPQQHGPSYGHGHAYQGYGQQHRPSRRGVSPWVIVLCVVFGIPMLGFASCFVCTGVAAMSVVDKATAAASSTSITPTTPLPISTALNERASPAETSTIDPRSCPRGQVALDVVRGIAVQCTGGDPPKRGTDWLVTLGKIVRNPLAVKPAKVEPDSANHATDYEYAIPPFSAVTLSVFHDGPGRWSLSITSSDSLVDALAPLGGVKRLCDVASFPPSTWLELRAGPLSGAFALAASADRTGEYSTSITSSEEMEADKAREEAEGAARADSVRERVCAGRAKNSE